VFALGDLEEAFDSSDTEASWFKMRKEGVRDNVVKCIRKMYNDTKLCVKCSGDQVTDFVKQGRGERKGVF
jgi:hypothetical protein